MSRWSFLVVLILFPIAGHSQLQKGLWAWNGEWLASRSQFESISTLHLSLNPRMGYFIDQRIEIGGGLIFDFNKLNSNLPFERALSWALGINPYMRYFPTKIDGGVYLFTELDAAFFASHRARRNPDDWTSYRTTISAGLQVVLNAESVLEGKIGYHFFENEIPFTNLDVPYKTPSVNIAMRFYLNRKKEESAEIVNLLSRGKFSFAVEGFTDLVNPTGSFSNIHDLWFGYFYRDRLFLGTTLGLQLELPQVAQRLLVAPFIQKYFYSESALHWFIIAQMGMDFFNFTPRARRSNFILLSSRIGFGVSWFLNDSVALEGSINYNFHLNSSDKFVPTLPLPKTGLALNLGFRFFLP